MSSLARRMEKIYYHTPVSTNKVYSIEYSTNLILYIQKNQIVKNK